MNCMHTFCSNETHKEYLLCLPCLKAIKVVEANSWAELMQMRDNELETALRERHASQAPSMRERKVWHL
jgi:hypothetical protein